MTVVFQAMILHCKAILGRGQLDLMRYGKNHASSAGSLARPLDLLSVGGVPDQALSLFFLG